MRTDSSHVDDTNKLLLICNQFDNASNTVQMAQALSSFIFLVHNQRLFRRQFSFLVHRNLTVQLCGLNPREKLIYLGVCKPFYMHLLDIDKRKNDLLKKVCQTYYYFPRTSVDPNNKLVVGRGSEFGNIINRWVASVDLERLHFEKDIDILALYLLQHNIKGIISSTQSEAKGSTLAVNGFEEQRFYSELIQFQQDNPDIGSLDQAKIISNFCISHSAVYLAKYMYTFIAKLANVSEFRAPSNLYKAEAVEKG